MAFSLGHIMPTSEERRMEPSSRTPEGRPHRCPLCGKEVLLEASFPPGDATCPHCGHLLWLDPNAEEGDDQTTVIRVQDEAAIRQVLDEFEKGRWTNDVVLDCDGVEFFSSSAIGLFIRLKKLSKQKRIRVKLCNVKPTIMEVFKLMNLQEILETYAEEQ
jgi:anti-anti-sigma factor